jgi:hypothetical protein
MFQRGQKIIILESSANKKTHPKVGDVGYLDNMYLFANDRFILISAFFFQYKKDKDGKDRIEKKRFVIDLGMRKNLRLDLSDGVSIASFVNKEQINLTSTGYTTKVLDDGVEHLIDYPFIHSNYGIWNNVRKDIKNNSISIHNSEKLYKIPYGHIALFSNKYNSKYKIEDKSHNEFIAWIKSMMPVISSMYKVFCTYPSTHDFGKTIDNCFKMAESKNTFFLRYINYLFTHNKTNEQISRYYLSKNMEKLNKSEKASIIEGVNFINSLNNIFMQRLDSYYINRFNELQYKVIREYIRDFWIGKGISNKDKIIIEIIPVINIIKSVLYRTVIMPCNIEKKIDPILSYLPAEWRVLFKDKTKRIKRIKLDADNNSSALNRIYEVVR